MVKPIRISRDGGNDRVSYAWDFPGLRVIWHNYQPGSAFINNAELKAEYSFFLAPLLKRLFPEGDFSVIEGGQA